MKYFLIFAIVSTLCMIHPGSSSGQPSRSPVVTTSRFTLTPFRVYDDDVLKQKTRRRSDVVKSDTFTVVVVASWCHYSQDLLKKIANGTSEVKPDLILFKESEVDDIEPSLIKGESDESKISEIKEWAQDRRQANQLLVDPAAVEHKLLYYFAPNSQLESVDGFPTVLSCNARTCTKMSLRDRLNLILQQGGMEPLGK